MNVAQVLKQLDAAHKKVRNAKKTQEIEQAAHTYLKLCQVLSAVRGSAAPAGGTGPKSKKAGVDTYGWVVHSKLP